jgi:hypothetical protein
MLTLFGNYISESIREVGRKAIRAQRSRFTASEIAQAVLPYLGPCRTDTWPEATPWRVALALADELIWEANRAGIVRPGGSDWFGSQYWKPVSPVREGS